MKKGYLSEFFSGIAVKRLTAVEADVLTSNQHEFNGVEALKRVFGQAVGKTRYDARFIYLDDSGEPVTATAYLTWYDAREAHPSRSEHRLYFPDTAVSQRAAEGDLLVIGCLRDGSVLVIVAGRDTTAENQIRWLFDIPRDERPGYTIKEEEDSDNVKIGFVSRLVLEEIGIFDGEEAPDYLEVMLHEFKGKFPSTRTFSEFARKTVGNPEEAIADPDSALIAWMSREEVLFRTLERHIVRQRLVEGFKDDVDTFISYSLSVQNRRKSRVGSALENHLEEVFIQNRVQYDRTKVTENKSKPDFIFPGIRQYRDSEYCARKLTMLGVKSTCKDRWRQVLAEANRIHEKHLLTLETGISVSQTEEMKEKGLSLVIPKSLHDTYLPSQQSWLISLKEFIEYVTARQI